MSLPRECVVCGWTEKLKKSKEKVRKQRRIWCGQCSTYLDGECSSRAVALDFALFGGAAVGDIVATHCMVCGVCFEK